VDGWGEGTGNKARGNTLTARRRRSASGAINITLKAKISASDAWYCYCFGDHDADDNNNMRVRIGGGPRIWRGYDRVLVLIVPTSGTKRGGGMVGYEDQNDICVDYYYFATMLLVCK
jgi:hypothetical protein